jgi:group I intron endonuclease
MLVYLITNKVNGKIYVGKWLRQYARQRWATHKCHAVSFAGGKRNHLQAAIRKYGPDAFMVSEIDRATTAREVAELETYYIDALCSYNSHIGYNKTHGGEGGEWTEERKKQWSVERKSLHIKLSPETREKIRQSKLGEKNPFFGKTHTRKARRKMSDASLGKKQSTEHVAKRSQALMGRPGTRAFLGRTHTKAAKEKMSKTRLEMYATDPSLSGRVSEEMKRNWEDPKIKAKMMVGLRKGWENSPILKKGHHVSEETKRRISEAQKRRFAARRESERKAL